MESYTNSYERRVDTLIKDTFEYSKEKKKHDICVLLGNHSFMYDDFMFILSKYHRVNVWPKAFQYRVDLSNNPLYNECYNSDVKKKIKFSKIIVAFVNNEFVKSDRCKELLKFSRFLKKKIIAVVVEEIKNYETLKEGTLRGFYHYCEIFTERITPIGYDQYLWNSDSFARLVMKFEIILHKNLSFEKKEKEMVNNCDFDCDCNEIDGQYNAYDGRQFIYFVHAFYNEKCFETCTNIVNKFKDIKGKVECILREEKIKNCFDIGELMNINNQLIDKQEDYSFDKRYDACLEYNHIVNKNDYLNLIKYFDRLIDSKLRGEFNYDGIEEYRKIEVYENNEVMKRIEKKCREFTKRRLDSIKMKHLINEIFSNVSDECNKLNIDLKTIDTVLKFLNFLDFPTLTYHLYSYIESTYVFVILLSKHFYDSGYFQKLYIKLLKAYKSLYVLQLDDFKMDFQQLGVTANDKYGFYDLSKYKNDSYDGYDMRRVFYDIFMNENIQLNFQNYKYKLKLNSLFVCYPESSMEKTKDILQSLQEQKYEVYLKSSIENSRNEIFDRIEKSEFILFFLTNKNLVSSDFHDEYKLAKKLHKNIIIMFLEPVEPVKHDIIFNSNQLSVIKMYKTNEDTFDIHRINYLIKSTQQSIDDENTLIECFVYTKIIKKTWENYYDFFRVQFLDLKESNHLLMLSKYAIYIYDRRNMKYKKKVFINFENSLQSICFINSLRQICFVTFDEVYLMDLSYTGMHRILKGKQCSEFSFICYSQKKNSIYIYDEHVNKVNEYECVNFKQIKEVALQRSQNHELKSMKIVNNLLCLLDNDCLLIYDLDICFVIKLVCKGILDPIALLNHDKFDNYVFIVDTSRNVKIFNLNNFKYCGVANLNNEIIDSKVSSIICADNLLIQTSNEIHVFKIKFSSIKNCMVVNEKYFCKLNPLKQHLLLNPFVLSPCGNIACLECIYKYYNLVTNNVLCPFSSCINSNLKHFLTNNMEKSSLIDSNIDKICFAQVDKAMNTDLKDMRDEYRECFENHFELIEDYLEIRLESIRIKIDQHQLKSMRALDKFQNRLVGHKQRKKVSQKFQLYFNFKKKFLIQHLQIAKEEVAFIS